MSILDQVGANKNDFIVYKLSLMFDMIGLESQTKLELTPSLKKIILIVIMVYLFCL